MNSTCELLSPDHFDFDEAQLDVANVMLESLNCEPIRTRVLDCYFKERTVARGGLSNVSKLSHYVRDGLGEVYQVSLPRGKGKCGNQSAYIIQRRVIDTKGRLVRPLCYQQFSSPPRAPSTSRPPLPTTFF